MNASKGVQILVVVALVTAAFFIGRSSVGKTAKALAANPAPQKQNRTPLSAIPPKSDEKTADPRTDIKKTEFTNNTVGSPQDLANAKSVSEFLAVAAGELENLWETAAVIQEWMEHDPDGALDWLADGDRRNDILRVMFAIWGEDNLEAASNWLAANKEMEGYQHAAAGLAVGLVENDQSEAALAIADEIDDPLAKSYLWTRAGMDLYEADPDSARDRLGETDLPENLQRILFDTWRSALSNRAKRNAQNLASVFSSAQAAGAQFHGGSAAELASELVSGVTGSGSFATTLFQVPNMNEAALASAIENLAFEQGGLSYRPAPEDE